MHTSLLCVSRAGVWHLLSSLGRALCGGTAPPGVLGSDRTAAGREMSEFQLRRLHGGGQPGRPATGPTLSPGCWEEGRERARVLGDGPFLSASSCVCCPASCQAAGAAAFQSPQEAGVASAPSRENSPVLRACAAVYFPQTTKLRGCPTFGQIILASPPTAGFPILCPISHAAPAQASIPTHQPDSGALQTSPSSSA